MPELVIGGRHFAAREKLSEVQLMFLARATKSPDPMAQLAGMADFIMALVVPDERAALEHYLKESEPPLDELSEAAGTLITSYTDRPTNRPSPLPAGSPTTGRPSRVVSLSAGTVREVDPSSMDGKQAAS